MATNVINGTDLYVFVNGVAIAHSTSHTLTITRTNREISTKDSGAYVTRGKGRLNVSATCSALMVYGSFETIVEAQITGSPVNVIFGKKTPLTGVLDTTETYANGSFYITSVEMNAPDGDNATYTVSFECDGTFNFIEV